MLTFGARSLSFNDGIWHFSSSKRFFKPMRRWRSMLLCKLRFSIVSTSSCSTAGTTWWLLRLFIFCFFECVLYRLWLSLLLLESLLWPGAWRFLVDDMMWLLTKRCGVCDPYLTGVEPLLESVDVDDEMESSSDPRRRWFAAACLLRANLCATVVCSARRSRALGFVGRFFSIIVSTSISSSVKNEKRRKIIILKNIFEKKISLNERENYF